MALKLTRGSKLTLIIIALVSFLLVVGVVSSGSTPMGKSQDAGFLIEGSNSYEPMGGSFSQDAGYSSRYSSSGGGQSSGEVATDASAESPPGQAPGSNLVDPLAGRSVITRGSLTMEVDDPAESADSFGIWIESRGGYVEDLKTNSFENKKGDTVSEAVIRVRIKDMTEATQHLKSLKGEVVKENITREDVTAQVTDLDARIRALEISIERLEVFLAGASKYNEIFQIERELTSRQGELDSLTSQRRTLAQLTDLQTLTVNFTTTEEAPDKPKEDEEKDEDGFMGGLKDGWDGVVTFMTDVFYLTGGLLTWLIVLVPAGLFVLLVSLIARRRFRKA